MNRSRSDKPVLRIIHQLGRSGGTLISKCLAVMDNAVLLSEIHPLYNDMLRQRGQFARQYSPMVQAHEWYNLLSEEDIEGFKGTDRPKTFQEEISLIAARCRACGKNLILRDYNNFDFTGIKLTANPPYRFSMVEALQEDFDLVRYFTVRHPADQWLSLAKMFKEDITPSIEKFLHGFRLFSEQAVKIGFTRYEDLTRNPEGELKKICERLDLPYDATWRERWASYPKITGDNRAKLGKSEITPSRKRGIDANLRRRLEENADYRKSLKLLGYEP